MMGLLLGLQANLGSSLTAGFVALVSLITSVCCYRLFLHPLAKYPGRVLARLTDWVTVYQTSTGDRHLDQLEEHRRYGPVVRVGPNTLSFSSLAAVKEIYANRQGNVRKAPFYTLIEASAGKENSIHAEVDRSVHAAHRRVIEHAFTDKSLRSFEPFLLRNVQTFRDIVLQTIGGSGEWSTPLNMSQWATYLNYDIMGDLVFGRRFNCMTSTEHRFVPSLLMNSTAFIYTIAGIPLHSFIRPLLASGVLSLPFIGGKMAKDERRFYHYAEGVLGDRIATEDKTQAARKDIMHHLIQGKDSSTGERFTRKQLNVESSLLIAAGADTTSLTLAAIFFYLLRSPRVMEKLVEEIQSTYNSNGMENTSPSVLLGLPYLRAVVDETLRLAPPVPSHLPREVLRDGITIDGHFVPKGTIVGVSAYAIHRNPEYYPAPDTFYPERWIVGSKDTSSPDSANVPRTQHAVSIARQAFVGFSQGLRGCVGRQLAYYELHTAVALLLNHFEIRSAVDPHSRKPLSDTTAWRGDLPSMMNIDAPGKPLRYERRRPDEFQLVDRFLSDRNGPMVQFKRRANRA